MANNGEGEMIVKRIRFVTASLPGLRSFKRVPRRPRLPGLHNPPCLRQLPQPHFQRIPIRFRQAF